MYSLTLVFLAFECIAVRAGILRRAIAPYSLTGTSGTVTVDPVAQASAYNQGLSLSGSAPDAGNVTADSIRLVNFDGCSNMPGISDAEAQIYSGWQQAQKIMAVQAIQDGAVDFNTAGALEYLGAAGLNSPRQGDMNVIFKNFATLTPAYWPFGWRVHVRCDDPALLCTCSPSTVLAYTSNSDSESKLARINFCPRYFSTPSLNTVLDASQNLPASQKYDMNRYWETQGHVWTHELMHIDWVTGASGPAGRYGTNEHVTDLTIQFTDSMGRSRRTKAYGPEMTKILARWPSNTGDYTIRNADNLALFMTSQYAQSQLGNAYPQYPVVDISQPDNPPYIYDNLFIFNSNGSITLNDTNPLAGVFADANATACITDEDEPDPVPMVFSSFAPESAYPSDYVSSLSIWVFSETWAPDSVMTAPPAVSTSLVNSTESITTTTSESTPTTTAESTSTTTASTSTSSTTSAPSPSASDTCKDSYKFFFDHFEISGQNFDATKFGDDGSGLKQQIKGCGDLTKWNFQFIQNDPNGWQWTASGNLPIGTKGCVGRAVVSAGGDGPGGCTGAG